MIALYPQRALMGLRDRWLARRVPASRMNRLENRSLFILPSRSGLMFLLTAVLIFLLAVNYVISLAFALAFFMVALFLVTMWFSHQNLRGLTLVTGRIEPGFAGEEARCHFQLRGAPSRSHHALSFAFRGGCRDSIATVQQSRQLILPLILEKRGWQKLPRLRVESCYPVGLFRCWAEPDPDARCLVYPKPVACNVQELDSGREDANARAIRQRLEGSEEFIGLRDYRRGDPTRRIAWKAMGRSRKLQVKEFAASAGESLNLDWSLFPGLDAEQRLSRLCHLALLFEKQGETYALRLPGVQLKEGSGTVHLHHVLQELALWQNAS